MVARLRLRTRVLESKGAVADLTSVLITSSVLSSRNSSCACTADELERNGPALFPRLRVPGSVALFSFSFALSVSSPLEISARRNASIFSSGDGAFAVEYD